MFGVFNMSMEFLIAVANGDTELVERLLAAGNIDINFTCLEIDDLGDNRLNLDFKHTDGISAAHIVASYRNKPMYDLLIKYQIDINYKDHRGLSSLEHVIYEHEDESDLSEAIDMIHFLLDKGVKPTVTPESHECILAWALFNREFSLSKRLIDQGANPKLLSETQLEDLESNDEFLTALERLLDVHTGTQPRYSRNEFLNMINDLSTIQDEILYNLKKLPGVWGEVIGFLNKTDDLGNLRCTCRNPDIILYGYGSRGLLFGGNKQSSSDVAIVTQHEESDSAGTKLGKG